MTGYIGIGGTAKKVKNIYVGVGNVAKKVKKGYIGVNGVAQLWYKSQREWVWDVYQYGYNLVEGTSFSQSVSSAFYAGTSYTLNQSTGQFSVNQTTQIVRSSTGASNAVGKYIINLTSSSGTQTGNKVYLITNASYSVFSGMSLTITPYSSQIYRGTFVNSVIDLDITTYPMNGVQGNYWYVLRDIETLSYSGDYIDQCIYMENKAYRLLTITSSGTLALDNSLKADIWICGGGAGGKSAGTNHDTAGCGGGGAYATEINNTNIKDLNIIIGAGGTTDSVSSSSSENVNSCGGTSSITGDLSITTFGGDRDSNGVGKYAYGGTGAGGGNTRKSDDGHRAGARVGVGDGQSKLPFNSSYFPYSFCDGGGGGGYGRYYKGGAGGSNGSNGGAATYVNAGVDTSGAGGGHYGGKGGRGYYEDTDPADNATGYGSGGGGAAYTDSEDKRRGGTAGIGYQGVCFIRIPLE